MSSKGNLIMKLMIKAGIVEPAEMLKYSDYLEAILLTMQALCMTNEESLKTLDLLLSHMRADMQRTIKAQSAPTASVTIDSRCPTKSTH